MSVRALSAGLLSTLLAILCLLTPPTLAESSLSIGLFNQTNTLSNIDLGERLVYKQSVYHYLYYQVEASLYDGQRVGGEGLLGAHVHVKSLTPYADIGFENTPEGRSSHTALVYAFGLSVALSHGIRPFVELDSLFADTRSIKLGSRFILGRHFVWGGDFQQDLSGEGNGFELLAGYIF